MKFGVYKKCVITVALYECGMMAKMIPQTLKPLINKWTIHFSNTSALPRNRWWSWLAERSASEICIHATNHSCCTISKIRIFSSCRCWLFLVHFLLLESHSLFYDSISVPIHSSSPTLHYPLSYSLHLILPFLTQPGLFRSQLFDIRKYIITKD